MKMPISIFPNVTEYTRANWTGYLKPRDVTLKLSAFPSYATLTNPAKGLYCISKPAAEDYSTPSTSIGDTIFTFTDIPANSKLVIVLEPLSNDILEFEPGNKFTAWQKGKIYNFDSKSDFIHLDNLADIKPAHCACAVSKSVLSGTFTWSQTFGFEGFKKIYYAFVDADRLDACLSGNHLKSISVGDKLGLVYWDGTECVDAGESMFVASKDYNVLVASYSPPNYGYGLKLLKNDTGERTEPFLLKAGTVNLSAYDATITGIETTGDVCLKDHLWHVI
jgi:hypothetical protein